MGVTISTVITAMFIIAASSVVDKTTYHLHSTNPMVLLNNTNSTTKPREIDKSYYESVEQTTSIPMTTLTISTIATIKTLKPIGFTATEPSTIITSTTTTLSSSLSSSPTTLYTPATLADTTTLYYGNLTSTSTTQITNDIPCPTNFEDFVLPETELYCNWTWDGYLCWPPTAPGIIVKQKCPKIAIGIDITQFAERKCGIDGRWINNPANSTYYNPVGWTNFSNCFRPDLLKLLHKCNQGGNCTEKLLISEQVRILEIVGLTLSLFTLLISLIIFCNFRSLRNARTKIHKNLFVAMVIQVVIRLILYFDQAIIRPLSVQLTGPKTGRFYGIENTPYLCEGSYVLLEYARTAMFMWMFIEGLYLHSGVTWMTGARRFPYVAYAAVGWGAPLIMTAIWSFFTAKYKENEKCWFNYNLTPYYWILEGPRLAVVLLNLFFLLNIIRVLIVKLRQSHSSDLEQLQKAVRAAIVLLPLLGITNLLYLTDPPLDKSVLEFAIWSYVSYFFSSFQGLFIAVIYCFLNGEVRTALKKSLSVYMSLRGHSNWAPRQASMFSGAYNTAPETEGQLNDSINRRDSNSPSRRSINRLNNRQRNDNNGSWTMSLCFRGQKVLREPPASTAPETNV